MTVFNVIPSIPLVLNSLDENTLANLALTNSRAFEDVVSFVTNYLKPADQYAYFNAMTIKNETNPHENPQIYKQLKNKIRILAGEALSLIPEPLDKIKALIQSTTDREKQGLTELASKSENLAFRAVSLIESRSARDLAFRDVALDFARQGLEGPAFRAVSLIEEGDDRDSVLRNMACIFARLGLEEPTVRALSLFIRPGTSELWDLYTTTTNPFLDRGLLDPVRRINKILDCGL